jgi:hypothetical protein
MAKTMHRSKSSTKSKKMTKKPVDTKTAFCTKCYKESGRKTKTVKVVKGEVVPMKRRGGMGKMLKGVDEKGHKVFKIVG